MDATIMLISFIAILASIIAFFFTTFATFGGEWITDVSAKESNYFAQLSSAAGSFNSLILTDEEVGSLGLFRIWKDDDNAIMYPMREPELILSSYCLMGSCLMGIALIVTMSYYVLGFGTESVLFGISALWLAIFQSVLSIVGTLVGSQYFYGTFNYEFRGWSHHLAWVGFAITLIPSAALSANLYMVITNKDEKYKERKSFVEKREPDEIKRYSGVPVSANHGGNSVNTSNIVGYNPNNQATTTYNLNNSYPMSNQPSYNIGTGAGFNPNQSYNSQYSSAYHA